MTNATFQFSVVPKRMLTKSEAAHHCGRPIARFLAECPCEPVRFINGDKRFDVKDLDAWLDSLKVGASDHSVDSIIEKLG